MFYANFELQKLQPALTGRTLAPFAVARVLRFLSQLSTSGTSPSELRLQRYSHPFVIIANASHLIALAANNDIALDADKRGITLDANSRDIELDAFHQLRHCVDPLVELDRCQVEHISPLNSIQVSPRQIVLPGSDLLTLVRDSGCTIKQTHRMRAPLSSTFHFHFTSLSTDTLTE